MHSHQLMGVDIWFFFYKEILKSFLSVKSSICKRFLPTGRHSISSLPLDFLKKTNITLTGAPQPLMSCTERVCVGLPYHFVHLQRGVCLWKCQQLHYQTDFLGTTMLKSARYPKYVWSKGSTGDQNMNLFFSWVFFFSLSFFSFLTAGTSIVSLESTWVIFI